MNTKPTSLEQLSQALDSFSGTDKYHRYRPDTLLTDGAKYLAEMTDCYWLIDRIAEAQTITFLKKADGLQSWTVTVHPDNTATVDCTNIHGRSVHRQEITHTDFLLGRDRPFQLLVDLDSDRSAIVVYLPSER